MEGGEAQAEREGGGGSYVLSGASRGLGWVSGKGCGDGWVRRVFIAAWCWWMKAWLTHCVCIAGELMSGAGWCIAI